MPYYDVIEELYILDYVLYYEPIEGMTHFDILMNGHIYETSETRFDLSEFEDVLHIQVKGLYENGEGRYSRSLLIKDDTLDIVEVEVDALNEGKYHHKALGINGISHISSNLDIQFDDKGLFIEYQDLLEFDHLNLYVKVDTDTMSYYLYIRIKDRQYSYLRSRHDIEYKGKAIRLLFHRPDAFNIHFEGLIQNRDFIIEGSEVVINTSYLKANKVEDLLILSYVIRDYNRVTVGYIFIR
jgi:hypothetical protein